MNKLVFTQIISACSRTLSVAHCFFLLAFSRDVDVKSNPAIGSGAFFTTFGMLGARPFFLARVARVPSSDRGARMKPPPAPPPAPATVRDERCPDAGGASRRKSRGTGMRKNAASK